MSSEKTQVQAQIVDFDGAPSESEGGDGDERLSWQPSVDGGDTDTGARARCKTCGNTVSQNYARVFGDNNDEISMCPECSTYREFKNGAFHRDSA